MTVTPTRPVVAREGFEPPNHPVMSGLLYLAELSRHGWPPRNRTAHYLRIRQAPSTSWVVASGEGESRTRKAEAQLLSGQIPSPIGLPLHADGGRIERPRVVTTRPPVSNRAPFHSVNHPC